MTEQQVAILNKYRAILESRWGIRKAAPVLDPDGWTAAQVIGGRE